MVTKKSIKLNEQVNGFPIEQTSVNFTDALTIKPIGTPNTFLVVINCHITNNGETSVDLQKLMGKPILKCGNQSFPNAEVIGEPNYVWRFYNASYKPKLSNYNQLMPNESLEGEIRFNIGNQELNATQLVFTDPPLIIDLSSG